MDRASRAGGSLIHRALERAGVTFPNAPAWLVYLAGALACTVYTNGRAGLVVKSGEWYVPGVPFVLLQVRAFLAGRLAVLPTTLGAEHDYSWGRGGLHQAWGLGVPILAVPFHLLGRIFGAPGFPDDVRFLVLYAATAVLLARALHGAGRPGFDGAVAGTAAAGFVMVFPTFVGLISARFLVFEQTIATGALWDVALLAGLLLLTERCTPRRLVAVCAAAGFAILIRPPLGVYGVTTAAMSLFVAHRSGASRRALAAGAGAFLAVVALYFAGNVARFGAPLNTGYETCLSGYFVNRMSRWNLPFSKAPILAAAKELFATLFLLDPVAAQTMDPGPSIRPYLVPLERWREFYSPTYDRCVLVAWLAAAAIVVVRVVRGRLWRKDAPLDRSVLTGLWALAASLVLFVFYSRAPNLVTRYVVDLYPAFAAAALCVGNALVGAVELRAPSAAPSARLAIATSMALYLGGGSTGWPQHLATPVDAKSVQASISALDSYAKAEIPTVAGHIPCEGPRGPSPVHTHLEDWHGDCTFTSGLVFAFPKTRCISFRFRPASGAWGPGEVESLNGFRATADFDHLVSCGPVATEGDARRITMCEPHPPPFVLEGMRLYSIATLDSKLVPIDRLKLMSIDAAAACP